MKNKEELEEKLHQAVSTMKEKMGDATMPRSKTFGAFIAIRPVPKGRPRCSKFSKQPYTPQKTRDYEKAFGVLVYKAMQEGDFEKFGNEHLGVELVFYFEKARTSKLEYPVPDLDNLVKSALDAMNGILFEDDRRIVSIEAHKAFEVESGVYVLVREVE